jgi:hypothetical protein
LSIIDEHPIVRAVVSGHLHHPFELHRRGVRYLGAPSTCVQAQHGLDPHLALVDGHPAGQIITLNPDAAFALVVFFRLLGERYSSLATHPARASGDTWRPSSA